MTITCPNCKAVLTIPDDRIPKGRAVTAACPQCKGKIVIDATEGAPAPAAPPPAPAATAPAGAREEPASYAERSQPKALVCVADPAARDQVLAILKGEAYLAHVARDAAEALERTRFTLYEVMVLQDGFGGDGNPVLEHLAELRMARRRLMHVVFVSPGARSHDWASAFARSVNLVLHESDLPHLAEALRRSRAEADQAQRVLLESLRALGKA